MLRQVLVCGLLVLVPVSASARPHRLRAAEALLSEIEELVDDELLHSKVSGREHAFAGDEERSFWRKKKSNGDAVMMDNPMYEEDDADDEEAPDDAAATSADDEEDNELTDFKPDLINDVSSVSKIWMKSHKADGVEVVTINAGNCGVNFRKLSGVSVWGKGEGDHCKINQLVITATNKKNTQSEETDETLYKKLTDSHAFTLFKELFKAVPGATELTTLAEAANFFGHAESIKNVLDKTADQDWEFVLKKISSEAAKLGLSAITGGISETFLGVIDVAKAAKAWYTKNRDEKKEREEAELEQRMLCTALNRIGTIDIDVMETHKLAGNIALTDQAGTEANLKQLLGEDLGELTTYKNAQKQISALMKAAGYRTRGFGDTDKIGLKRIKTKRLKRTKRSVFLEVNVAKFMSVGGVRATGPRV